MKNIPIKRALISVADKTGIVEFAQALIDLGIEIISTGGTSKYLHQGGIPHRQVHEITGLPPMLGGRVKTLHPAIFGGILGRRDNHAEEAARHQINWIDLVVVNFYPFEKAVSEKTLSWDEAVEHIDIGGPTMVRAAAKNFAWAGVVVDPADYAQVASALKAQLGLTFTMRKNLAQKAFALTSHYDAMIYHYFLQQAEQTEYSPYLDLQLEKKSELRYGENPHQKACAYRFKHATAGVLSASQVQGKPLSYNNILDAEAAWNCVSELTAPTAVIVKHANPCGAASASSIDDAYHLAHQADSLSAFGGIIALNRPCTQAIAESVAAIFMEVILAPAYTEDALAVLAAKPNLRVLIMPESTQKEAWEMKFIHGGLLLQEKDRQIIRLEDLNIVTDVKPVDSDFDEMQFAWSILKHIKSNGILITKNKTTVGIGAGQVSRIDAVDLAIRKAGSNTHGALLASDAFFPFRDSIDRIAHSGVRVILQPGGSIRDEEVIAACNEHGIAMVFTGKRCFRH